MRPNEERTKQVPDDTPGFGERRQRNRQAQTAFRRRRTEYIKQMEITLNILQGLQHRQRKHTSECLVLRYQNSLLEGIALEKGKAGAL